MPIRRLVNDVDPHTLHEAHGFLLELDQSPPAADSGALVVKLRMKRSNKSSAI